MVEPMTSRDESGEPAVRTPPGLLTPLPMPSAGERIADRLVTAIALGHYVSGQRLPSERDLAELLQVSRGPVREALQRLASTGHVEIRRGREGGAFVTGTWSHESDAMVRRALRPEWDRIDQLLDLRHLLEQQVAAAAAARRTEADLPRVRDALASYEDAGDREDSRRADAELHEAISAATHNPLLVRLTAQLRRDISLGFDAEPYSERLRRRALEQHPRLVEAIVAGDPVAAARVAGEHFDLTDVAMRGLYSRTVTDAPAPH